MKFCKRIDLPDPLGPNIIDRIGSFDATLYLDCLTSYSFNLMGFMVGISSDILYIIRLKKV